MKKHLAVYTKEYIGQIFKGLKTIDTRFSQKKIPPFGQVSSGDLVYIKLSGEEIKGQFLIKKVIYFENLDAEDWEILETHYGREIKGNLQENQFFSKKRATAKYGTVIWITKVEQFITPPVTFPKRDQRGWVLLG